MRLAFVISVAVALAGCQDHQLEQLELVKADVCGCKTVACGEAAMKKLPDREIKKSHRSQQLARDMMDCMAKLYEQERPAPEPEEPAGDQGSAAAPAAAPGSAAPAR